MLKAHVEACGDRSAGWPSGRWAPGRPARRLGNWTAKRQGGRAARRTVGQAAGWPVSRAAGRPGGRTASQMTGWAHASSMPVPYQFHTSSKPSSKLLFISEFKLSRGMRVKVKQEEYFVSNILQFF